MGGHEMTKCIVLFVVWLGLTSQATAQWRISEIPEDVPGLPVKSLASLSAKDNASPVSGRLLIGCSSVSGNLWMNLGLSEQLRGAVSVSWRLDREPVQHQDVAELVSTPTSTNLALSPGKLARAKRLQAEWLAANGTRLAYDFKLAGAKQAVARVRCVKAAS
jgi:hypothetical protein